ncbi:hypothetical protein [Nonomuraea sp. SYSU D8015]|uniref:hypothetical protein n=1 Tax=Nonomuraea sp. SYSU D8015 TaxID=2593644 RepID=UPI001660F913|nr:hypothetical protein [Nonomuraea sp. SYSU D8015]
MRDRGLSSASPTPSKPSSSATIVSPLRETLEELLAEPLTWVGAFDGGQLLGALGRTLVGEALDRAGTRTVVVATGRDDEPARAPSLDPRDRAGADVAPQPVEPALRFRRSSPVSRLLQLFEASAWAVWHPFSP